MDLNDEFLQCATHGALFEPDSGYCVEGPCAGQYLTELPSKLRNGIVYIDTESEAPRLAIIHGNEK
jgi:nitrite reductase/ring-hydroxylating ferredoxin subunit